MGLKTPDIFRQAFHSQSVPPLGVNRGRFADPITDRLIAEAEMTSKRLSQQRLYRELQTRLLDTLPYVPLWYEDHFVLVRKEIEGYALHTDGNYDGLLDIQWTSTTPPSQLARNTEP